jgi:YopX protein.
MREHKYRAWDKAKQQMCEVVTLIFWDPEPDGKLELGSCELLRNMGDRRTCYRVKIENIDLMEYAGRKDEKGTDIFEGDVLGVDDPEDDSRAIVVFHDGAFKPQIKEGVYDAYWGGWIVIGNRYERSDLLEKSEMNAKVR